MKKRDIIIEEDYRTVVVEYDPPKEEKKEYQNEAELESHFIELLQEQGYEYLKIKSEKELKENLKKCLEKLNEITFTEREWENFYKKVLVPENEGFIEKTKKFQGDGDIQSLEREDGTKKNIKLINKKNIHRNILQVINQYRETGGEQSSRYDVTILVNGFPLVHIELKRNGIPIKEAFNQINKYKKESFNISNSLFQYIQIFVISNGTHTKYYSNTTKNTAYNSSVKKINNTFEFTSFWADTKNNIIKDIVDFTRTFFARHTILNILTKYCVLTSENTLLVMRPYQIVATESIINKIKIAKNRNAMGTIESGGYIWHTTGSGKTLTSFKTAQLASKLDFIDKVLFVVDRKDLDYQTMKEYDRFEKGSANSSSSTKILAKQMKDPKCNIIITTIQKLDRFIEKNKGSDSLKQNVVIIFDECHRSQFGNMHKNITKFFKNYYIFGFTGTPIFAENAQKGSSGLYKTTEQLFGEQLHSYTIANAIKDKNVLPFKIDYHRTFNLEKDIKDKKVEGIDIKGVYLDPRRIETGVKYILEHFDQKTKRKEQYDFNKLINISGVAKSNKVKEKKRKEKITGFNSILAVSSIEMAKLYYEEFKRQNTNLIVSTIFSYGANEYDEDYIIDDENPESADNLDKTSKEFLASAINDYNKIFKTNYDISNKSFQDYYRDLSLRMKNKEIDILIVVNMFLTGFDAPTLNTLWVDKHLKMHGLIQAFSRTNRIFNSVKVHGNIISFRSELKEELDKALSIFSDIEAKSIVIVKTFEEYYNGYTENEKYHEGYKEVVDKLMNNYPIGEEIIGEENQKEFINLFGRLLKLKNKLTDFDEFNGKEILTEADFKDYQGEYINFYEDYKKSNFVVKESISQDLVFEIELVKQIEVNIDYIFLLIEKYNKNNSKDKNSLKQEIDRCINSSIELKSKKELIDEFIKTINKKSDIVDEWENFIKEKKENEFNKIIKEENLKEDKAKKYIENCFEIGYIKEIGTDIDEIMPMTSWFDQGENGKVQKKNRLVKKLKDFFEKFYIKD